MQTIEEIKKVVQENDVVLFMKGTKKIPMCGFSGTVVQALKNSGLKDYKDVNILSDETLRQNVKVFSNWPTYPQLYVKGELVGGADIVKEMYQTGELETLLKENNLI